MKKPDCVVLAAQIVTAYLAKNTLPPADISSLLRDVHGALKSVALDGAARGHDRPSPMVPIKRSVAENYVVCLMCGSELQSLRRHLGAKHAMTTDAYRHAFGLSAGHALVAPSYSRTRSRLAVRSGLGRKSSGRRSKR